jgi:hypothetical protein
VRDARSDRYFFFEISRTPKSFSHTAIQSLSAPLRFQRQSTYKSRVKAYNSSQESSVLSRRRAIFLNFIPLQRRAFPWHMICPFVGTGRATAIQEKGED